MAHTGPATTLGAGPSASIDGSQGLGELLNCAVGGSVADLFMLRTAPLSPEVDRVVAKYPYEPTRAARLFAEAGWQRLQPDGLLTNASGQNLPLEIRATAGPAG